MTEEVVTKKSQFMSPELGGVSFELKEKLPRFAMMGLVAAQSSNDQGRMTEAMWRLCRSLIIDWGSFENLMTERDELFDELDEFVMGCLEVYKLGPTEESSDSSPSSMPTPITSRVVSLEQGTVEVQEVDPSS